MILYSFLSGSFLVLEIMCTEKFYYKTYCLVHVDNYITVQIGNKMRYLSYRGALNLDLSIQISLYAATLACSFGNWPQKGGM